MKRVFNVAEDDGLIVNNPCDGGGRLYSGSRAAIIWTPDQLAKAKAQAPLHIRDALVLAAETGQRQAALLELLWSQVDTDHLRITQNKNRKPVSIRLSRELRALLQDIKRRQTTNNQNSTHVLTNSRGLPWTQDGFQTSWRKAMKNLKIEGVTFHDLRGTAITRWAADGATVPQIAALSGHSMRDVEKILEAHYLADHQRLGDAVILRIDGEQK
ncbi:tyrosine-type recombinase/integrase [Pseudovibrio sp. SPO723]|uniref:tyrosine-type recombinase/integrase n=1 Tax=Nesiotobacter zosterae TaxID=392721 RepID=UPI0029C13ADD|nr:tyrosine-type recombinase/integrase [Pseudovibrio sp. SPO723]MDX5593831.1 tyrosine-type recombinase/integrase [Pseudovibrio sp. SPO723]